MLACSPNAHAQNGYPGSAHYTVAYSGGTWSSSGGPSLPLIARSGGDSGGVNGATYGGGDGAYGPPGSGFGSSVSASGTITATFTWTPTAAMEPPPPLILVEEDGAASYGTYGPARGGCDDGVGDVSPPGGTYASLSGTKYILQASPGGNFSVTCNPSANSKGPADPNGTYGFAWVSFKANVNLNSMEIVPVQVDATDPHNSKIWYQTIPANAVAQNVTFTAPAPYPGGNTTTQTLSNVSGAFYLTFDSILLDIR